MSSELKQIKIKPEETIKHRQEWLNFVYISFILMGLIGFILILLAIFLL